MSWDSDIKEWPSTHRRDVDRQKGILLDDGCDPNKYQPSMKKELFEYLDKWHTLHIKNMPQPATSKRRRNPSCFHDFDRDHRYGFRCEECGTNLPNIDLDNYEQY